MNADQYRKSAQRASFTERIDALLEKHSSGKQTNYEATKKKDTLAAVMLTEKELQETKRPVLLEQSHSPRRSSRSAHSPVGQYSSQWTDSSEPALPMVAARPLPPGSGINGQTDYIESPVDRGRDYGGLGITRHNLWSSMRGNIHSQSSPNLRGDDAQVLRTGVQPLAYSFPSASILPSAMRILLIQIDAAISFEKP